MTFMYLVECDNGIIKWNVGEKGQKKEDYEKKYIFINRNIIDANFD